MWDGEKSAMSGRIIAIGIFDQGSHRIVEIGVNGKTKKTLPRDGALKMPAHPISKKRHVRSDLGWRSAG
jgi:hypothetical protein